MITTLTPVDRHASTAVLAPADRCAPALSEVAGSVAGLSLGRRVMSPVMRADQRSTAPVTGTQPVLATRIVQHDVTDFGTSTKVQDPPRGVPV